MSVPVPKRIAALPLAQVGAQQLHVPFFVEWIDGVPDFRVTSSERLQRAVIERRCWTCGQRMHGPTAAFVIGPMCAVNRISSEPPSHPECARYAAHVCPFLTKPTKRRRESNLPDDGHDPAGLMIRRNPGVALVWIARHWRVFAAEYGNAGLLFDVGPPTRVEWYAEGRAATRAEVMHSIETGLPELQARADSPAAEAALQTQLDRALQLVPA